MGRGPFTASLPVSRAVPADQASGRGRGPVCQGPEATPVPASTRQVRAGRETASARPSPSPEQDFYSHSNWVELGQQRPHPHLLWPRQELGSLAQGTAASPPLWNALRGLAARPEARPSGGFPAVAREGRPGPGCRPRGVPPTRFPAHRVRGAFSLGPSTSQLSKDRSRLLSDHSLPVHGAQGLAPHCWRPWHVPAADPVSPSAPELQGQFREPRGRLGWLPEGWRLGSGEKAEVWVDRVRVGAAGSWALDLAPPFAVGDPTCTDCEELSCPGNLLGFPRLTSGYFGTYPSKPPGTRQKSLISKGRVTSFPGPCPQGPRGPRPTSWKGRVGWMRACRVPGLVGGGAGAANETSIA